MNAKYCRESRVIRTSRVFQHDVNSHNTLFGGRIMSDIDQVASIAALRHCRTDCVTASTDSVDFLFPIKTTDAVCYEAYVTWTNSSSMEIFAKVIAENLKSGDRKIAATAFLTFVAIDENKRPVKVPEVIPKTKEERMLNETAPERARIRKERKEKSKEWSKLCTTAAPVVDTVLS
ncbi:acyl-CoA thioesterase [Niallia endozanthoxylica]|uniref:Acyl-CoA thioesterase n=1 Tax=Niallia endozanthoxylica TaxID=2036016 RepID=A0A5J5HRD8_9BACI|nr:acyl-CoA thioesterase [Niallia endozanthoxylica]KAA9022567.1 acyl-CoA thioesterase [Niallia endozanthoxylica]